MPAQIPGALERLALGTRIVHVGTQPLGELEIRGGWIESARPSRRVP